jgi:hypothetical protein
MLTPEKVVPVAAVLIFAGALVFLLWGDVLGVSGFFRSIPAPILFAVALAAIALSIWQARRRPKL